MGAADAFRSAPYRWMTAARVTAVVAERIIEIAVGWQVYERTGSPLALGFVGLVQVVPVLALALWTGVLADRRERRSILLVSQVALAVLAAALAFWAREAGAEDPLWPLYAILFGVGVARAFQGPAMLAILPNLVPLGTLANAVGWRAITFEGSLLVGPLIGGAVVASAGPAEAYLLAASLEAAAVVAFLRLPRAAPPAAGEGAGVRKESLLAGVRYVVGRPEILSAITLDLVAVLFGGATAMFPIFARDILKVGPQGLGFLRAAPSAGSILSVLWLVRRGTGSRPGRTFLWCVAGFGAAMAGFGFSRNFALSLSLLAAAGMCDGVSVVIRHTIVQGMTPDAMRGRVSAVNGIFITSSNQMGEFESGVAAALLGVVPSVVAGGLVTVAAALVCARCAPSLVRLSRLED